MEAALALEKAKKFCAYQERAISDVARYLQRFQVAENDISDILKTLQNEDFLNEERFVQLYIRGKMNTKQWGTRKIFFQLRQKGVSEALINRYLSEVEETKVQRNLDDVIAHWKRSNELTHSTLAKLQRHLLSKGYTYEEIIKKVKI